MENQEKKWVVYRHVFPNKKCYIGITCRDIKMRWGVSGAGYLSKNLNGTYHQPLMANAILKYGWDNVQHEILFEDLSHERANRLEQICILLFRTTDDRFGYNITEGGDGSQGRKQSEETKKKIGEKAKKRLANPENNPRFGVIMTKETRKKISDSLKGKYVGEDAVRYGKTLSEESKEKIRQAHLGKKASNEAKQKMSEAQKGKRSGENSPNKVPVVCLNLKTVFITRTAAAEATRLSATTVADIYNRKINQAKGYYFIKVEDFNYNYVKEVLMQDTYRKNPVVCVETNDYYRNCAEARRAVGVCGSSIRDVINGKDIGHRCARYHWRKATDEEINKIREEEISSLLEEVFNDSVLLSKIEEYKNMIL